MDNLYLVAATLIKSLTNSSITSDDLDKFVESEQQSTKEFLEDFFLLFGALLVLLLCFCCDSIYGDKEYTRDPNYDSDLGPDAQWFRVQPCYVCGKKHRRTNVGPCAKGSERPLFWTGYSKFNDTDNMRMDGRDMA